MRLLLCATVLAASILAAQSFPADIADQEPPRKNPSKPVTGAAAEKPRPSNLSKPSPQVSDSLQSSQPPNTFISDVAQSTIVSELPGEATVQIAAETVVHDPILEVGSQIHAPESVAQDAIPEVELPEAQFVAPAVILDNVYVKVSPSISGKSRRHAGVEASSALRIGDFEDVENGDMFAPEFPEQMEMNHELSKEEIILMAMEQMHKNRPQNNPRPVAHRPGIKPHHTVEIDDDVDDDDEANDSTVDLRNSGEPATIVQEVVAPVNLPASRPQISKDTSYQSQHSSHVHHPYGSSSKNKPRPYGMDRPSKNRPTLDSGMKNEHFGLPHSSSNDYIHKGEMGLGSSGSSSSSSSTSYLGFPIPTIKWASLSDFFPNFWGSQTVKHGMLKSDPEVHICVDDDEVVNEGVRSPSIQSGSLCGGGSSGIKSNCSSACISNGFSSGSCLGPYPTPGCMCRHRSSEEYGLVLKALEDMTPVPEANREQDLQMSVSAPCKKCACQDSCKKSGSFTGFCTDRCYCAVPWSMKRL